MELIDKDALVAEIDGRIKNLYPKGGQGLVVTKILKDHYEDLLIFINTLEVQEVDLEKELKYYCNNYYNCDYPKQLEEGTCSKVMPHIVSAAKHFFELGLKVQKGE